MIPRGRRRARIWWEDDPDLAIGAAEGQPSPFRVVTDCFALVLVVLGAAFVIGNAIGIW